MCAVYLCYVICTGENNNYCGLSRIGEYYSFGFITLLFARKHRRKTLLASLTCVRVRGGAAFTSPQINRTERSAQQVFHPVPYELCACAPMRVCKTYMCMLCGDSAAVAGFPRNLAGSQACASRRPHPIGPSVCVCVWLRHVSHTFVRACKCPSTCRRVMVSSRACVCVRLFVNLVAVWSVPATKTPIISWCFSHAYPYVRTM